ncbi:hypothetical protein BKA66DRAFT_571703 [Pyrenochaeta sp. MPI-SDFR-AT-0127]|nr:hypothetical protein BKA66DRAFT_571703 [Pyrenochaeta sp. MPI-SDFR-AT-0127]
MRFFDLPHACGLLLVGYVSAEAVSSSPYNEAQASRVLRAATKRADLYRRSVRIAPRFDAELAYIERENAWNGESTFASQVKVRSQKPVFNLEEFEHHLQDAQCSDDILSLHFVDKSSARDARFACHGDNGGLVITSHESCNDEGERAVYRVENVSFAEDGEALELSVTKVAWRDAFESFDISFGQTSDDHLYRRHSDFTKIRKKRQNAKVEIPADTPENVNTISFDLSSSLVDTVFPAESFLAGLGALVPIPQLPIEIGCKSCTTSGRLALTQGAFKIDASQIDLIPDVFEGGDDGKEITSVITGGFIELVATGLGARLEMFARPITSGAFEIALFKLPVFGFVIPGIGKAGAVFEPRIAADFEVSGGLELNYGIEVAVPDNSNIRIELADITNSRVNGFPGSTLTPLPFSVNVTEAEILLGLAFVPSIPIGFEFMDKLRAEAIVSMNLPRLDAKLSTNAQANCGNQTGSNTTVPSPPYANTTNGSPIPLIELGPLVLVEANISLTVDVGLGLTLPFLPPPFQEVEVAAPIFSTLFPLVTSCVSPGEAFKTITGIVVAPTSSVYYANSTVTPGSTTTPCNTTVTTHVATTVYSTSTKTTNWHIPPTHEAVTSHVVVPSYPIKEPIKPSNTTTLCSTDVLTSSSTSIDDTKPSSTFVADATSSSTSIAATTSSSTFIADTASSSTFIAATTSSVLAIPIPILPPSIGETRTVVNSSVVLETRTQTSVAFTLPSVSESSVPPPGPVVSMPTGFLTPSNASAVPVRQTDIVQFTGAAVPGPEAPKMGVLALSMLLGALMF